MAKSYRLADSNPGILICIESLTVIMFCFPGEGKHFDLRRTVLGFGFYSGKLPTPPPTDVLPASEIPDHGPLDELDPVQCGVTLTYK